MRQLMQHALRMVSLVALFAIMSDVATAQSSSRGNPPGGSNNRAVSPAGSGQRAGTPAPLALEGYCPVSLQAMQKWVKGNPSIQTVFDGHTYYFANEQGRQMFSKDLVKYAPALGGDCVVSLVEMGKRVPGNIRQAALHDGRLFLFANAQGKKMFLADTEAYADADLAYDGKCVVCSLNMKRAVPGKAEFTVIHKGMRYRFPSAEQRNEFVSNPEKYESVATSASTGSGGSASRGQSAGSGSSSR